MKVASFGRKERKYLVKARKYVPTDRRHVTGFYAEAPFKRGVSTVKRSVTSRTGREIMKKPVAYKSSDRPVMKPRKPEGANVQGSAPRTTETSAKTMEVKKQEPPSVEPTTGGHYELSPMLSKMVEAELQDAMMKVWELQPNNPQDSAERIVADRFRNKAGEALRNTLGLNITKRLLNVHNPLYVKMVFSGKPLRAELIAFLKKYNVSAFKRVGDRGGTFAAKMRSFQDFDDLCTDNTLKCGTIRVTVTPCYQFMTCPPNLRTPYDGKEAGKNNDANDKPAQDSQETIKTDQNASQKSVVKAISTKPTQTNAKTNQANTTAKVQNQTESVKIAPKVTPVKAAADTKSANEPHSASKVTPAKPSAAAQAPNPAIQSQNQEKPAPKITPTKPTNLNPASKVNPNQASVQNTSQKSIPTKVTNQAQNTVAKVATAKTIQENQTAKPAPKVTLAKVPQAQNLAPKVTPVKATQETQNIAKTPAKVATLTKVTTQNATLKALSVKAQQNSTAKATPKQGPATTNNPKTKVAAKLTPGKAVNKQKVTAKAKVPPKKKPSDFDELSDHDILALISEGIVLDECSGSDAD